MRPDRKVLLPAALSALLPGAAMLGAVLLTGCGKATVHPGPVDAGFSLASLRADTTSVIVEGEVRVTEFEKSFEDVFGSGDSLAAAIEARLLDSLNRGVPALPARAGSPELAGLFAAQGEGFDPVDEAAQPATPETAPRYILRIRNVTVGNALKEIPSAVLPSGTANSMAPAGGGTSESCVVAFDVEVWENSKEEGTALNMRRRAAFSVTGKADVLLYAYKSALEEAVAAAVRGTAKHLRQ